MIKDLNLKLAIIYELRSQHLLPNFDKQKFWQETFQEKYDMYADYNYKPVPEVIAYYQNYTIPVELLAQIKKITWIEFDICCDINDQWDGEDNSFEIASLEGIEHCKNLEELDLQVGLDPYQWEKGLKKTYASLEPLEKLAYLKKIRLAGMVKNLQILLEMPQLQKIKLDSYLKTEENMDLEVFGTLLAQKGILE